MTLDRFYPIFDSAIWIERLVPIGIKLVQLRIKNFDADEIYDNIKQSKFICERHNCTLVVNDYWQAAIDLGCDYVHLGQEDLDDADIPAIHEAGLKIGISTHDRFELKRAMTFSPDYIALGPIYPTILKNMRWHPQGLTRLTTWRKLIGETKLVAIGGMSIDRSAGAFVAGADVVAAVTDITLNQSPEDRVRSWLAATR